jgi:hypothetical protein
VKDPSPTERVRAWEETVTIQTYPAPAPDRNPMFLDKRVYQGSSGKVYPNPFTDHVSDTKFDKPYRAIFLENEYIRIMILPEIGGRIHIGQDKVNNYDFFYRQKRYQTSARRPAGALDFRGCGVQLAAASPTFHIYA